MRYPNYPTDTVKKGNKNINVAVLYADADQSYWGELERHLGLLSKMHSNVRIWTVKDVELGAVVKQEIRQELSRADITLLLLSADFAIENVFDEETRILLSNYAASSGKGRYVLPVIVQDFMWRDHYDDAFDIEKLKFFDRIIQNPENRDAIYQEITETLNQYIKEINARSIRFVIPTWVGFIGGIMYNNGFVRSRKTPLFKQYKRALRYELSDNVEETCNLMASGEADLIWATLDRLPSVLYKLKDQKPKVIAQVSWSNGADAVIARNGIQTLEDLKGKKVIYPYDSPAFTFLKYVMNGAGMDTFDIVHLPQKNVDLDIISKTFQHDESIDAIVLWSPYAESCLAEVPGTKVIAHTGDYPNLITDVIVATEEFVNLNRDELRLLFQGWFAEVTKFTQDELYKIGALGVLIEAIIEPLPAIIPSKIRTDLIDSLRVYFQSSLEKVHLSTLEENRAFFHTNEGELSPAAELYNQFLEFQFPEFLLDPAMQWDQVVDSSVIDGIKLPE
ncbi:MAG: ABC transporter substrate-binding protein [Bacteroidota bacterium]